MQDKVAPNSLLFLVPVAGILLFMGLYILAALLYPGGSYADHHAIGFSWQHNYWCNLMADQAINGKNNTARPVAISAMIVLCIALIIFWNQVPRLFNKKPVNNFIRYCGMGSMLSPPFLSADAHDLVINLGAGLGCLAILALLTRFYAYRMNSLLVQGIICLLLCVINNYVYYSDKLIHLLPVVQKVTFLIFLLWFMQVSLKLYRKESTLVRQIV